MLTLRYSRGCKFGHSHAPKLSLATLPLSFMRTRAHANAQQIACIKLQYILRQIASGLANLPALQTVALTALKSYGSISHGC